MPGAQSPASPALVVSIGGGELPDKRVQRVADLPSDLRIGEGAGRAVADRRAADGDRQLLAVEHQRLGGVVLDKGRRLGRVTELEDALPLAVEPNALHHHAVGRAGTLQLLPGHRARDPPDDRHRRRCRRLHRGLDALYMCALAVNLPVYY